MRVCLLALTPSERPRYGEEVTKPEEETKRLGELSYEEAEAIRRDPEWGDPVLALAVHAHHWLESAVALHPELADEIDQLSDRLSLATGDETLPDDRLGGAVTAASSDGEIVRALSEIVEIMRIAAPLVSPRERHH